MVKNLPVMQETRFDPWVEQIPWRREWQPTQVKSHGQRSLVGYSPWGHKESDRTEQITNNTFFSFSSTILSGNGAQRARGLGTGVHRMWPRQLQGRPEEWCPEPRPRKALNPARESSGLL